MAKLIQATYDAVRGRMKPGDDIMFSGTGPISSTIKIATHSVVTHIGTVFQTWDTSNGKKRVKVIESTSLNGSNGVVIPNLSSRLRSFKGEVWWCPLSTEVRELLDEELFFQFMHKQKGKKYDYPQAIGSALDAFDCVLENEEDLSKLFCSELRTAALEIALDACSDLLKGINASEVTPDDCCHQELHGPKYYQIAGDPKEISNFN